MLEALWKKYDKWAITSFLTVGLIFGLNGSVQTSILLLFYEPQSHCQPTRIHDKFDPPPFLPISHSHQTNSQQSIRQQHQQLPSLSSSQNNYPNKDGYFSNHFDSSSLTQEFKWLCNAGQTEKLITESSMGAGVFVGFLLSFFIGKDYSIIHRSIASESIVYQILGCITIQTISLLTTPFFAIWYHAAVLLFLQSATQAFLYSAVYKFISLKYGTVIQRYSSVIYQVIWTILMIIFLIFARFFSGWRAILFYYQGIPQGILLIILVISLQLSKKQEIQPVTVVKSSKNIINLSHNNELDPTTYVSGIRPAAEQDEEDEENSETFSTKQHHMLSIYQNDKSLSKMDKSLSHQHHGQAEDHKTSIMLSRFQTEEYFLTIQVNYSQNDSDTFGGKYYPNAHGDQLNQSNLPDMNVMFENLPKFNTEESIKKVSASQLKLSMNQAIVENIKQKYILDAVNLREQQDQIIQNSDLNVPLDQITNNNITLNNINNNNSNNNLSHNNLANNANIFSNMNNSANSGTNTTNFNSFSNNHINNNNQYNNNNNNNNNYNNNHNINYMRFSTQENEPQRFVQQNTLDRLESSGSHKTSRMASQHHNNKLDEDPMKHSSPTSPNRNMLRRNSTKPVNNTSNQYQQEEDIFFSSKNINPSVTNPRFPTNPSSSSQIPLKILMPYQLPSMHYIQQNQQQPSQFNIQAQQSNNNNGLQSTQFNMISSIISFNNNTQFQQEKPQDNNQMQQMQQIGMHQNTINNNNSIHNQVSIVQQNNNINGLQNNLYNINSPINHNINQTNTGFALSSQKLPFDQNITFNQINTMQTIRTEMRTRWMQLKRDPNQKNNIATFICCWIIGNSVNYGIYFALLQIPGDIYMKLILCGIIEMASNYIASFVLIRFDLKCVILMLFFIAGCSCCATFWMEDKKLLVSLFITKLCLELFFPVKTYFLQFVIHSQYFSVSVGLADTLAGLVQAFMPLLVSCFCKEDYLFGYLGIGVLVCFLLLMNVQITNIIGLNTQFSLYDKSPGLDATNLEKLADILEVDSAADHSLYSSAKTIKSIGNQH